LTTKYNAMLSKYKKYTKSYNTEIKVESHHKWLIIVESPSKCTKIEHYLGSQYKCIASKGHLREIDGLKSIDTKKSYEPKFSIMKRQETYIESIRKIIQQFASDKILLATDDDREGEAIAWHICEVFNLPIDTTPRVVFHEVTQTALCEAVANPTTINMNIVKAQHARQILDMLIGYKISPILWKYMYNDKENSLSAGRCQTPALRLVYDNHIEKLKSNTENKYKIVGNFFQKNIDFTLNKELDNKENVLSFLNKSIGFNYQLSIGSPKESLLSAPKPFNTSSLLQSANSILGISPKDTMKFCQILYQDGHITYMRTDNRKYSSKFIEEVKPYIQINYGEKFIGDTAKIENLDKTNPHEAIRITKIETKDLTENGYENGKLASLYKLIWKNTVQSCMSDFKCELHDVLINAPNELHYKYTVESPLFMGWKGCIQGKSNMVEQQNSTNGMLLYFKTIVQNKITIAPNKIHAISVFHNSHYHFTESSLIKKLEDLGIGRPSTYAMFIETIQDRGYVKKMNIEGEKFACFDYLLVENAIIENAKEVIVGGGTNKLVIQSVGLLIVEFLMNHFQELFSYDYTKNLEDELDSISTGNKNTQEPWYKICNDCNNTIKELIKSINTISKEIYHIDDNHDVIFSKYGPVISQKNKNTENNIFIPIKKGLNLDLEKLKSGNYSLDDLMESANRLLGKWDNQDIYIKMGRYGAYLEWGDNKKSCNDYTKKFDEITIDDCEKIIKGKMQVTTANVLRVLNDNLSIRKGKFGAYIYFKTPNMSKPKFFNLKKFNEGFSFCDADKLIEWTEKTYNISTT
jgi:DNA topoisomerase-1